LCTLHLVLKVVLVVGPLIAGCGASAADRRLTRRDVNVGALTRECEADDLGACESLGGIYLQLDPPETHLAIPCLEKACRELGSACATLAEVHAKQGNNARAQEMLELACARGWKSACAHDSRPQSPSPEIARSVKPPMTPPRPNGWWCSDSPSEQGATCLRNEGACQALGGGGCTRRASATCLAITTGAGSLEEVSCFPTLAECNKHYLQVNAKAGITIVRDCQTQP
jgi:hypothetical protein